MILDKSKLVVLFAVAIATSTDYASASDIVKAWSLYKQGDYIGSISLLDGKSEEELYLRWLNEVKIGGAADATSVYEPNSPQRKYYDYVKKNKEFFVHDEACSCYLDSGKTTQQLEKLYPKSEYLAEIKYAEIKDFDEGVWEDSDGSMHSKDLISSYNNLIQRFPNEPFVPEVKKRIAEIKKRHKQITGEDL
jgi:outer membrane protein assembly factor BamD (BamD/ComL family)